MFRRLISISIALIMFGAIASAQQQTYDQDQLDEAYKRMQQRLAERQAATSQPATQPTSANTDTPPDESEQPQSEKSYTLALRPDAPSIVKSWFQRLPELHRQRAAEVATQTRQRIAKLEADLDQAKRNRERLISPPAKKPGAITTNKNQISAVQRRNQINAATREIERLAMELRTAQQEAPSIIDKAVNDRTSILMPRLLPVKGYYGTFRVPVKVLQIIDDNNVLIKYSSWQIWLHGIPTESFSSNEQVQIDTPFVITGTKEHRTAMSAYYTVLYAEPMPDVRPYVYLVEYNPDDPSSASSTPQSPASAQSQSLIPQGWQPQVNPTNPAATAPSQ